MIQEAQQDKNCIYPLFETNFPKKINFDEYDEPVGKHFGEWKHWDTIHAEIQSLLSATSSSGELQESSLLTGGEDSFALLARPSGMQAKNYIGEKYLTTS
eukprot:scaffold169831_cov24-Attheya_sp.AAC.1